MPEELYRPGTELRIITANRLHYGGPVLSCQGDWIVIRDRIKDRSIRLNLNLIESLEVLR